MEKKKRQSGQQKHAIEREQKIQELRLEFKERIKGLAKWFGTDVETLYQIEEAYFFGLDEEKWINDKLKIWENEKRNIPSGLYQEPDEPKVIHQQKFVEAIKNVSPHVIEELKPLVQNFNTLFGEIASDDEFLEKLKIIGPLQEPPFQHPFNFPFTPSTSAIWQYFAWKRYKVPLLWAKYCFDSEKLDKNSVLMPNAVKIWFDDLYKPTEFYIEQAEKGVESIKELIVTKFQEIAPDKDLIWENFLTLQCGLYSWMERNFLERDFLFEKAYIFLFQFSQDENLATKDLKLWGRTFPRRLQSYEFEFKTEGWWAADKDDKDYKKRVTKEFKAALDNYIVNSSRFLNLSDKLHATKPKDPDYESIYWLMAWNEGATMPQIAKCFNRSEAAIDDGLKALVMFDLPKRIGKPGRKGKNLPVSDERIREIRKIFLESKETKTVRKKGGET